METKKSFICWNKKRAAAAIAMAAAMLVITGLAVAGEGFAGKNVALAVFLSLAAGFFVLLDFSYGRILSAVLYILLPFAALTALEHYTHVITDLKPSILVLNLLFFYLLYGLCALAFGSVRTGFLVATLVPMICGLANYFVVSFRGTPIVPWDLLSIGTAMSVADNYEFTLSWKSAFVLIAFLWMILIASKSSVRFGHWKMRLAGGLVYLMLMCFYVTGIQKSEVQSFFGMDTVLFTLNVLYRNNGIAGAFLGNLRYLNIEEPSGYSAEKAEEIAAPYLSGEVQRLTEEALESDEAADAGTVGVASADGAYPNIIVIMDEAFSDLSVWGDFETSEEVMPFFKMMQEEGIGGELYVSVKGGNTANTEFEFLTGNTMGFLPAGSIPYQQYISSETPSLASYLKSLGYDTLAIHPYNRSGWDRDEVYDYFGFDEFLDIHSFDNPHRMRGYVSDRAAFEKIIEQFELKGDNPLFTFEVTMQNHGGYSKPSPDFTSYIKLSAVENKTTSVLATEKYLTLMNETDNALQELILYLQEQDEPTVVVMFGDHQPSDYITNVIQRICGVQSDETLEYVEQGYRVPFLIWSNYGLEHAYYDGISVNYLSGLVLDAAGVPQTGYQNYLSGLMETLPIINGMVYRDSSGTFYNLDDDTYGELLAEYQTLQYNHLVDKKHRMNTFFGAEE